MIFNFKTITLLLVIVEKGLAVHNSSNTDFGKLLYSELREAFTGDLRPVRNSATTLNIGVYMSFKGIVEFNEISQYIVNTFYFKIQWIDEYINWDPDKYGGIKRLALSREGIWTPDLTLKTFHDGSSDIFSNSNDKLRISNGGEIRWSPYIALKSTCHLDTTKFPFDIQTCPLVIASGAYILPDLTIDELRFSSEHIIENSQWHLESATARIKNKQYGRDGDGYSEIHTILHLKRRPAVVCLTIVLPICLLSILNILILIIPHDTTDKLSYSVTILLSFAVFLSYISDSLPKNGKTVSLLTIYLACLIALSTFVVIMTSVSLMMLKKTTPMSSWLRKLFRVGASYSTENTDGTGKVKNSDPKDDSGSQFESISNQTLWRDAVGKLDTFFFLLSLTFLLVVTVAVFCKILSIV